MKISRKIGAPASFIFDKLIESSLYDIKQQTGEELSLARLKGYTYTKTFSNKEKAEIIIDDVVENKLYQFQTLGVLREFQTTYRLKELGETRCEITCEERQVSHGTLQKYNDLLVGIILGWQKKRQMKYLFEGMAASYLQGR